MKGLDSKGTHFCCTALSCRCIKLQLGGEAAQAEAWDWLAANELSALVTTKESR